MSYLQICWFLEEITDHRSLLLMDDHLVGGITSAMFLCENGNMSIDEQKIIK